MLYHPEVGDDFSEQEILSDIEEEKSSNIEVSLQIYVFILPFSI